MNAAEEKNESVARDFLNALEARQIERVLSCFADNGVWISPEGTFTGKAPIRKYLEWQNGQGDDIKIKESGNGTVVTGNRAFIEHSVSFRRQDDRIEYIVLCALEIKDGKLQRIRTVYDRLSLEQKMARDRISKWAVEHTLKQAEKKLRG